MIFSYGSGALFGTQGMLVAIVSSLLSMELYSVFENNKKLELTLPAGVPPAVARSFSKLFPTIFTLLIFIAIQAPFIIFRHLFT
jgi:PTS system cellobiose-specific IIC component